MAQDAHAGDGTHAHTHSETFVRIMGFLAGTCSGVAKNTVGHPFDTIKVRMQTSNAYKGPLDCVLQTWRTQGVRGFYLGFTPPLAGWIMMDAVSLGSMHNYRLLLKQYVFTQSDNLPLLGTTIAGGLAGWTVSFIAAPVELVKAKLQVQVDKASTRYTGPVAVARDIYGTHGIRGLYKGLWSTLVFRSNFFILWTAYEILGRKFREFGWREPVVNFWAGGLSASVGFWITAYPSDVVKQVVLVNAKYNGGISGWAQAARDIWREKGHMGFWRGFTPSILRSFPANAAALVAFESVLRATGTRVN